MEEKKSVCACWDKSLLPNPPSIIRHSVLAGMASLRLRNVLSCFTVFLGLPGIQFKRKSPFSAVLGPDLPGE